MKHARLLIVPAVLLLAAGGASGDVRLGVRLKHSTVLQFEPVLAQVTIANDTDEVFRIDPRKFAPSGLRFFVERRINEPAPPVTDAPMVSGIELAPDESRELMVDVSRWYDLKEVGGYFLTAAVDWKGDTYRSNQVRVDVVPGIEMANTARALPGQPERVRTYRLRYLGREQGEFLFFRADEEPGGYNYGVFDLGPIIRVARPTVAVDRNGNVTVWHQSGRDRYTRSTFQSTAAEVRFVDQTYHKESRPKPEGSAESLGENNPPPPAP